MQSTTETPKSHTASKIPFPQPPTKKAEPQEHTGVYEIQALARAAKTRQSRRMSSQMEAQESLLRSASALDSVALPNPKKSQEISIPVLSPELASQSEALGAAPSIAAPSIAAPIGEALVAPSGEKKSKAGLIIGGGLVLAAAAAAAFFLMKGDDVSKSPAPQAAVVADMAATAVAPEQPEVAPLDEQPAVAPLDEQPEVNALAVTDEVEDEESAETEEPAEVEEPTEKVEAVAKSEKKVAAKKAEKTDKPKAEKKVAAVKAEKAEKKAEPEVKKETPKKKASEGASLDDVLSSVTGGVNERIAAPEESNKPSKKKLDRSDVSKAMKAIAPKAKKCYSVEEFSGSVLVKYSVGPDGKVTKASASGAHKSSPTGACVVKAVKSAKFPAFDGATMSFSFPFLLNP